MTVIFMWANFGQTWPCHTICIDF